VIWIRGNHDEFLAEFIGMQFGNIEIREDYILKAGEKNYFIFHGDIIDIFITKYKWLAKIGSVGYDLALWVNRWYNRYRTWRGLPYQSISQDIKAGVKAATNYVNDFETTAIKMAMRNDCEGVVCGHIHQPADRLIEGSHYLNSGDWVENITAIILDHQNTFSIFNASAKEKI
jgi:UDP-2,3-diacylglucosamine pyrophosphatase LpxH